MWWVRHPGWGLKNLRELNFHYSEIGQNLMESIHVAPSAVCDPANNFILKILSTKTSRCPWLSPSCCRQNRSMPPSTLQKEQWHYFVFFIAFEWYWCSWINSILSIISRRHFDLEQKAPIAQIFFPGIASFCSTLSTKYTEMYFLSPIQGKLRNNLRSTSNVLDTWMYFKNIVQCILLIVPHM